MQPAANPSIAQEAPEPMYAIVDANARAVKFKGGGNSEGFMLMGFLRASP